MASQASEAADQSRVQWYWKSNSDPWSTNEKEEWTKYSDIESAIIEEAFNSKNKTKLVELDNYLISLNDSTQISKSDSNKQRQIKRALISRNGSQGLREERFFLPLALSKTFNDDWGEDSYNFLSQWRKGKQFSDGEIVKQAANGIIIEGQQVGQYLESQYIARKLIAVEKKDREEIYKCCAQVYAMESFLYKLINKALRENDKSKVNTLGPFCYILFRSWLTTDTKHAVELYRGMTIDNNMLKSYEEAANQNKCWCWDGFTSTSRNRQKAQTFGNTLFIIDATKNGGLDISPLSDYDEEEVLLPAGTIFKIKKVEKNPTKHCIHLQLQPNGYHIGRLHHINNDNASRARADVLIDLYGLVRGDYGALDALHHAFDHYDAGYTDYDRDGRGAGYSGYDRGAL